MTDTPTERGAESIWDETAPPQGGAVGTRLRRRRVGVPAGPRVLQRTFDWPRQIQQLATLALLIGLPIVLVLAWYHGDRGQQRITRPEFAILTLLLLLGGGVFWYYAQRSAAVRRRAQPRRTSARTDDRRP